MAYTFLILLPNTILVSLFIFASLCQTFADQKMIFVLKQEHDIHWLYKLLESIIPILQRYPVIWLNDNLLWLSSMGGFCFLHTIGKDYMICSQICLCFLYKSMLVWYFQLSCPSPQWYCFNSFKIYFCSPPCQFIRTLILLYPHLRGNLLHYNFVDIIFNNLFIFV